MKVDNRRFPDRMRRITVAGVLGWVLAAGHAAAYEPVMVSDDGWTLTTRAMVDFAEARSDVTPLDDGVETRRLRAELEGQLAAHWDFELEVEHVHSGIELEDAFVRYTGWPAADLYVGNDKAPVGLEEMFSTGHTLFMERALVAALVPGRRVGVYAYRARHRAMLSGGVFGQKVDKDDGDSGWGVGARAVYHTLDESPFGVHLGAAAVARRPSQGAAIEFAPLPESHITDAVLVDTGVIDGVESVTITGLEAAPMLGPLSLQAEYIRASVGRSGPRLRFDGWYAAASYFITGEVRRYNPERGRFDYVRPHRDRGAWELLVRYSTVDLDSGDIQGGEQRNLTFGVNWHARRYLRLMWNTIRVHARREGVSDRPRIHQLRVQLDF